MLAKCTASLRCQRSVKTRKLYQLCGEKPLSRSYLVVRHLLRQLELKRENHSSTNVRPDWFEEFVDGLSQLFEPFSGVARVGFECACCEEGWEISIFLGEYEVVGGANDGRMFPVNFRFNIQHLAEQFDRVDAIHWNAFPNHPAESEQTTDLSFLTVKGDVMGETVLLQVLATPPSPIGPAIRQHLDGRMELV